MHRRRGQNCAHDGPAASYGQERACRTSAMVRSGSRQWCKDQRTKASSCQGLAVVAKSEHGKKVSSDACRGAPFDVTAETRHAAGVDTCCNVGRTREEHGTSGSMPAALQADEEELFVRVSTANVTRQMTYCGRHTYANAKCSMAGQR